MTPEARLSNPDPYGIQPPGYRLPARTRLGPVRLQVADLERSVDYYTGLLGLRVLSDTGSAATLGAHGPGESAAGAGGPTDPESDGLTGEPIVELRERPGTKPVRPRGRLGLFHFAILLPDRPSLGRFVAHLAEGGVGAGTADHAVSEAVYLQDPDGLGIEVYADRPRSEWRHRNGELVMGTDPLDVRGLRAAGGGTPWAGAPAGTTIGHVHLHVGDLERAAGFYHAGLGLDKVVWSYPGALFLSAGGYHHHLGLNTWAGSAPPPGEDEARLLEWTVVVPSAGELEGVVASLESAGHTVEHSGADPENTESSAETRGFLVRDPWRTAVRVASR